MELPFSNKKKIGESFARSSIVNLVSGPYFHKISGFIKRIGAPSNKKNPAPFPASRHYLNKKRLELGRAAKTPGARRWRVAMAHRWPPSLVYAMRKSPEQSL
jgi:hypothetical protein